MLHQTKIISHSLNRRGSFPGDGKPLNLGEGPLPTFPKGVLGPGQGRARGAHLAHVELTHPQLGALLVIGVGREVAQSAKVLADLLEFAVLQGEGTSKLS